MRGYIHCCMSTLGERRGGTPAVSCLSWSHPGVYLHGQETRVFLLDRYSKAADETQMDPFVVFYML
jgi:hypothetical protein